VLTLPFVNLFIRWHAWLLQSERSFANHLGHHSPMKPSCFPAGSSHHTMLLKSNATITVTAAFCRPTGRRRCRI
jgi:hypothetical protein